jgi:hypothetical protein
VGEISGNISASHPLSLAGSCSTRWQRPRPDSAHFVAVYLGRITVRTDYLEPRAQTHRRADNYFGRTHSPASPKRFKLIYLAGGLSLVLSFLLTLQFTKPSSSPGAGLATLASSAVHDSRSLMAAVKAAGLRGSPKVKGDIDEIKRLDADRVSLKGWAAEIGHGGTPLSVVAFAEGHGTTPIETQGTHANLTPALGLSDAGADNVSFQGSLTCRRGEKLIVVAVTQDNNYGYFGSRVCP